MKAIHKARVNQIREYLASVNSPISQVQAYEVLARALGYKNKHVLAASEHRGPGEESPSSGLVSGPSSLPTVWTKDDLDVPVRALGSAPYSVVELDRQRWQVSAVIAVPLDLEDVEQFNDYVSMTLVGNEVALEDIWYDHVPEIVYAKGFAAYHVRGRVSKPEEFFGEEMEKAGLLEFNEFQENTAAELPLQVYGHVDLQGASHFVADTSLNAAFSRLQRQNPLVRLDAVQAFDESLFSAFVIETCNGGFYDEFGSLNKAAQVAQGLLKADDRLDGVQIIGVMPSGQAFTLVSFTD